MNIGDERIERFFIEKLKNRINSHVRNGCTCTLHVKIEHGNIISISETEEIVSEKNIPIGE